MAKRYKDGGDIVVTGQRSRDGATFGGLPRTSMFRTPAADGGGGGGGGLRYAPPSDSPISAGKLGTPVGAVYGLRGIPVGRGSLALGASPRSGGKVGGSLSMPFKKGGSVKKMAAGGSTASKRADGCAVKGKTKGRIV